MKDIDAQYYGYRDDDDGQLVPLEVVAEREAIAEAVAKWRTEKGLSANNDDDDNMDELDEDEIMEKAMKEGKEGR